MKIAKPKTDSYFNFWEGDCAKPIDNFYKKGSWKKYSRKKFFRNLFKTLNKIEQ